MRSEESQFFVGSNRLARRPIPRSQCTKETDTPTKVQKSGNESVNGKISQQQFPRGKREKEGCRNHIMYLFLSTITKNNGILLVSMLHYGQAAPALQATSMYESFTST